MEKTDIKLFETGQIKKKVHFEIYDKLGREKNHEKIAERRRIYNKKYQQDLKDDICQYYIDNKQAIKNNKQAINDYNNQYYIDNKQAIKNNKQAINDYNNKYYIDNKQAIKDNKQDIKDNKNKIDKTTGDTSIRRFFWNLGYNTWFKYYR